MCACVVCVHVHMCVCAHVCASMHQHLCGVKGCLVGIDSSTIWVPGIKARPSGLVSTLTWWDISSTPLWQYQSCFMYVFICVCVYMYVQICSVLCVCMCIWRVEVNLKSPPPFSSHACMASTLLTQPFPSSTFLLCLRTKPWASCMLRMCTPIPVSCFCEDSLVLVCLVCLHLEH